MRTPQRLAVVAAGFTLAVTAVLATAVPANAHDSLVDATPGDGDTVTTPISDVSLRYSGILLGVDTGANVAVVTGPGGQYYETGCATVEGTTLTLPVTLGQAGTYEVEWRVVSSDGHPISGQYEFAYEPLADAATAAGSQTSPCADVTAAAEPTADVPDQSGGTLWGIGIGIAAILVVGGAILLILRPKRARATATPPTATDLDSYAPRTEPPRGHTDKP